MSHQATNWAVRVRGISPAAKVVLWHLADRHNKDTGQCNPSQARLAEDCEISRSSLNNQLEALEKAGFIRRVRDNDEKTRRQRPTHYILNMDRLYPQDTDAGKVPHVQDLDTAPVSKNRAKPCPKNGETRVQNLDTNPVREPGREPMRASARENFLSSWVNGGKPVPSNLMTPTQAEALVAAGLVTEARMKEVGLL